MKSEKFRIFAREMKKYILILAVIAGLLSACSGQGSKAQKRVDDYRLKARQQFYKNELVKVQAELARTDSLLQIVEADPDTFNVAKRIRRDSLRLEADVQGARIRYIHKKQKELQ